MQLAAVHQEVSSLDGDARSFIHHIGTEAQSVGDGELMYLPVVAFVVERHAVRIAFQLDATFGDGCHHIDHTRLPHVRQRVGHEVAGMVGLHGFLRTAALGYYLHGDVRHASAVVETHIAFQESGVLAGTLCHLRLGEAHALAVVGRAYLILIVLQGRDGLVLVAQLVDIGLHFFPCAIVGSLRPTQHGEEVDGVAVGLPDEQHAALACLCLQRRVYLAYALVVEGGQRGSGIRGRRLSIRREAECHFPVFFLPTITEAAQHFAYCGSNKGLCLVFRQELRQVIAVRECSCNIGQTASDMSPTHIGVGEAFETSVLHIVEERVAVAAFLPTEECSGISAGTSS